jgi:hypothetical protein
LPNMDAARQENYEFWLQQDNELLARRGEAYNIGGEKQPNGLPNRARCLYGN